MGRQKDHGLISSEELEKRCYGSDENRIQLGDHFTWRGKDEYRRPVETKEVYVDNSHVQINTLIFNIDGNPVEGGFLLASYVFKESGDFDGKEVEFQEGEEDPMDYHRYLEGLV